MGAKERVEPKVRKGRAQSIADLDPEHNPNHRIKSRVEVGGVLYLETVDGRIFEMPKSRGADWRVENGQLVRVP